MAAPEIINAFLRALVGLIIAKILHPDELGLVAAVSLVFSYGLLLQLGAFDGATMKIYALMDDYARNKQKIQHYFTTSFSFIVSVLALASILCVNILSAAPLSSSVWLGIVIYILSLFVYHIFNYSLVNIRFFYQFKKLSIITTTSFLLRACITVTFSILWGLNGFLYAFITGWACSAGIGVLFSRVRFCWSFQYSTIKEILHTGFPIIVISSFITILMSIDRWFIIGYLDLTQLGYYSILITMSSVMLIIPTKVSSLLLQYGLKYFQQHNNLSLLSHTFLKLIFTFSIMYMCLIGLAKDTLYYVFRYILVQYQHSYTLTNYIFIATFCTAQLLILNAFFIIIEKKRLLIAIMLIAIPCATLLNAVFIHIEETIEGIALATACATGLTFLLLYVLFFRYCPDSSRLYIYVLATVAIVIAGFLLFESYMQHFFSQSLNDAIGVSVIKNSTYTGIFICLPFIMSLKKFHIGFKEIFYE